MNKDIFDELQTEYEFAKTISFSESYANECIIGLTMEISWRNSTK